MVVYSPFPVTIDGTSLDTVAWNIEAKVRQLSGFRSADISLAGVDGEIPSLNDDLESTLFTLSMWVIGTDTSGLIPAGTPMAQCRANVDTLSFLFRKRHALIQVAEVVDNVGTQRMFYGKVVDAISPTIAAGGVGKFQVNIKVPDGMWQDMSTSDWTQTGVVSGTPYEVTTMLGATEHIADSTILVTGPATNPQVTDYGSAAYMRYNGVLAAGASWRVNNATWATRFGAGLTLSSADTTGTDAQATTVSGGGKSQFLRLVPTILTGNRRVQLSLTGTGFTGATALSVRARRKYAQ